MTLLRRLFAPGRLLVISCVLAIRPADAATFTVTSTSNGGAGTLRAAIGLANADNSTPRVINFSVAGTITLDTALPQVTKFMTIDATTAPGYAGAPVVVINGNSGDFDGLVVNAFFTGNSANKTTVKGLCVINCGTNGGTPRNGMTLIDGDSVTVTGCYIGINAAGTTAARNTGAGVRIELPATTIGGTTAADRCVISGNGGAGIDANTDGSNQASAVTITGNYIGTSADGTQAVGNGGDGIFGKAKVTSGAFNIGAATVGSGNVISGNGGYGIDTQRFAGTVQSNIIGLASDGATAMGNTGGGVKVVNTSIVLGFSTTAGNVISSNGGDGVRIDDQSGSGDRGTIRNNKIGTDAAGFLARGNTGFGVNVIHGSAAIGANEVSGNFGGGIYVASGDGSITTNLIGVNADASAALGNGDGGITINNVPNLTISLNTIGGNTGNGITITGANATGITITGNFIGTGNGGGLNLGNGGNGIAIDVGAKEEIVGSATAGGIDTNVITFNTQAGIATDACNRILFNSVHGNGGLAFNPQNATLVPAAINSAVFNQFGDGATIDFTVSEVGAPNVQVSVLFSGNPQQDQNLKTPLGSKVVTLDGSGHFTGSVQVPVPIGAAPFITNIVVSDPASNPNTSCTSPVGAGFDTGGGGGPPVITNDTTGAHVSSGDTNEPINTFSGELFDLEAVDLNLGGPMPLFFARYYASKIASDGNISSALGRNRLHNFDAKLTVSGNNATAVLSIGRAVQFTKAGAKWTLGGRKDIAFHLAQSGANFILADPRSQRMWTFDATGKLTKIEDGRGNAHTLSYDGAGKLTSVSDGLTRTLAFTYDGGAHLVSVSDGARTVSFGYTGSDLTTASDALNHTTTFTYDGGGHLLSTMRPLGNSPFSQTYDGSARVATQTEHATANQITTLAYDTNTHATTITDPTGKTRVHTHTATGELSAFKDEENKTVVLGSDATGRRSVVTDRLGRTTTITYHAPSGKPASITAPDGAATTFTYKARALGGLVFYDLVKITRADGSIRAFTHDAHGNVLAAIDALGKKSAFTYNARGQLLTATNATGGVATFTYDAATGNLATSKDSDTGATSYTFDGFSRLTTLTHPDATHLDIAYDAVDRVAAITDERGKTFAFDYDNNGNVKTITDPGGKTTTLGYDALDRVTQITDRLGKMSSVAFDSRDLLASDTDELNHTTTIAHDTRQRVAAVTDAGNATTTFGYNDEAELTSVTDPLGNTSTLVRNKRGSVIAASDALGNTGELQRDALQRITKIIDPVGRASTLAYDKRGLLASASRDGIGAARFTHDARGALTKITDPNGSAWSHAYTPAGRVKASRDPLGKTTTFSYDTLGRLAMLALPEGGTCALARDEAGNVTSLNFSAGPNLQFGYDALGRVTSANGIALTRDAEGRITNSQQAGINFSATYDDAGRLTSAGCDNGALVVTYTYDVNDRLTGVSDNLSGATIAFAYDAAGRLTTITRSNGVNATFTYDAADRLTRIQDGTVLDLKFTLNAAGDITTTDITAPLLPAVTADAKQFKYDAASQVKAAGFAYDARGRLTASPGHTFAWDGASRLVALDARTLGYDGFGDATTRTVGGATTRTFFHHAIALHPPVAERNEANSQFTRFCVWTPGGALLYAIDAATNAPTFYHYDRAGSTLALTSAAGAVTDAYAYSPYGEPLGHTGASTQPFTFVGAFGVRAEGPLYQMRARYYDPLTARFLSRDPSGPRLADVRTLDPYLYALGDPTRYVDPEGTDADETAFALFFAKFLLGAPLPGELSSAEENDENFEIKPFFGRTEITYARTMVEQPTLPENEVFGAAGAALAARRLRFDEDAAEIVRLESMIGVQPSESSTSAPVAETKCIHAGNEFVADALNTSGTPSTTNADSFGLQAQVTAGFLAVGLPGQNDFKGVAALLFEEGLAADLHRQVEAMNKAAAKKANADAKAEAARKKKILIQEEGGKILKAAIQQGYINPELLSK